MRFEIWNETDATRMSGGDGSSGDLGFAATAASITSFVTGGLFLSSPPTPSQVPAVESPLPLLLSSASSDLLASVEVSLAELERPVGPMSSGGNSSGGMGMGMGAGMFGQEMLTLHSAVQSTTKKAPKPRPLVSMSVSWL